jgi:hypothetical protein
LPLVKPIDDAGNKLMRRPGLEIFGVDLRIVFLFLLAITIFLLILNRGAFDGFGSLVRMFLNFLLVVVGSATVIVFFLLLTRTNPIPYMRQAGYIVGVQQLVNFDTAIPPRLENNLAVSNIVKMDTDGDNFNEWVVFYNFDLRGNTSPVHGYVYDNDRGNPPVIFPYALLPPNRNFLSQGVVNNIELEEVVAGENGSAGEDLPEVLVQGHNELSMFTFLQNSAEWDYPRDAPPRYQPIGFFAGSGGVHFDRDSKAVTVNERHGFERSQLVNRQVFALNKATNTYWDRNYLPEDLDRKLAAPVVSTIDFPGASPDNILSTAYPENIVLAFYAATCGRGDATLCRNAGAGWDAKSFLDPNGDAYSNYVNGTAPYFGLPTFNRNQKISVKALQYFPGIETDPDLLTTGGGRDVVTGEQAQANAVDIVFTLDDGEQSERVARYRMSKVGGQWKIYGRLSDPDLPELGDPSTLGQ